jgi:hypothetical protein
LKILLLLPDPEGKPPHRIAQKATSMTPDQGFE